MRQRHIDFRELLERLLPLDRLPPTDRLRVQRALATGVGEQIEQAAMGALEQLERAGALRRLPETPGAGPVVRYQNPRGLDVISVQVPGPRERDGVLEYPRGGLPAQAQTGLDQVRRLLRLDDPMFIADPRESGTRGALLEQIEQAGREFLGAARARLVPLAEEPGAAGAAGEPALDAALVDEVRSHADHLYYCPDMLRAPALSALARPLGVQSVALCAVVTSELEVVGHLEVMAAGPGAFLPEELSLVALLADSCGRALERAARIEKLVFVDPLTSVYNRSYFDLQVGNEMARAQRDRTSMALLLADIDDFKAVNTAFGYEAGNQVLVQIAHALRHAVRPFDTVARWGGEEFTVLLSSPVEADDVAAISERLRSMIERLPVRIDGLDQRPHRLSMTLSIGVAMFPDHADSAQELWRAANQALLRAKRPPKNQVVFFQPQGHPRFKVR
jgi:diguanylate cyclase (GGDEF)-like protein